MFSKVCEVVDEELLVDDIFFAGCFGVGDFEVGITESENFEGRHLDAWGRDIEDEGVIFGYDTV